MGAIRNGAGIERVTEILDEQEAALQVRRQNTRGRKSALGQRLRETGKGGDIIARKPGHGVIAQRFALGGAGIIGCQRRFGGRGRVHQNGALISPGQAEIAPCGGIARKGRDGRIAPAGAFQKAYPLLRACVFRYGLHEGAPPSCHARSGARYGSALARWRRQNPV